MVRSGEVGFQESEIGSKGRFPGYVFEIQVVLMDGRAQASRIIG